MSRGMLSTLRHGMMSFPTGLIPRTLGPWNDFTLLNGWICLHEAGS